MRPGGEPHRSTAGPLRAGRPQRAAGPRAPPEGPPRDHRVHAGAGGGAPLGPGQPDRCGCGDGRGAPEPGRGLQGVDGRPRRAGRPPGGHPGRLRGPPERWWIRWVRHRPVRPGLTGARSRKPRSTTGLAGPPRRRGPTSARSRNPGPVARSGVLSGPTRPQPATWSPTPRARPPPGRCRWSRPPDRPRRPDRRPGRSPSGPPRH